MKKLIISAITAAALLFGFAGCSGDLHDDEKKPIDLSGGYYLVGSMTGSWTNNATTVVAFEKTETAGSYNVPFSADAAEVAFAFIPTPGSWDGQIGGDKMVGGTLPSGAKFESKDNGNGGKNGTISGLEAGGKYKLTVTALDDGTLKIDCSSNVPPTPFYLQNMYVRGAMIDLNPSVKGSLLYDRLDEAKGEVFYHVDFTDANVSNNAYGIADASSSWNVKYTGAKVSVDGDYIPTTKGASDNNTITGLVAGNSYRIYVKTTPDGTVYTKIAQRKTLNMSIKGCKLINYKSDNEIYFLEAWMPGNEWNEKSPNKGKATNGTTVVDFSEPYKYSFVGEVSEFNAATLKIQIVDWDGTSGFWDKKVCAGADASVADCESGKTYYLVYDAASSKVYFKVAE
mgnify:CR=1 FL=1